MLQLEGMSTAKIVLFHQGSTELRRCENCVFFLPVNILTGVVRRLLGPHDTLPCVLIEENIKESTTLRYDVDSKKYMNAESAYKCISYSHQSHLEVG